MNSSKPATITIQINDAKADRSPTAPVKFHFFPDQSPRATTSETKHTFSTKESSDYAAVLSQLKEFLEQKEIAGTEVAEIKGGPHPGLICFPTADKIKEIFTKHDQNAKACFDELMKQSKSAFIIFLININEDYHNENFHFKPLKLLFTSPLNQHLDTDLQKRLRDLQAKLQKKLSANIYYGKTNVVERLIDEGFPADATLLLKYMKGVAANRTRLQPKLIEKLITKGSTVNFKEEKTPLMLMFSCPYDKKNAELIKETATLLLKHKADIDTSYQQQTAYDIAEENDYPKDILQLIRPASVRRCRWC